MKKQKNLFFVVFLGIFITLSSSACTKKVKKPEAAPPPPPLTMLEKQQKVRAMVNWYNVSIENQKATVVGYDQFLNYLSELKTKKISLTANILSAIDKNQTQIDKLTEENSNYRENLNVEKDYIAGIKIMQLKAQTDRSLALDDLQKLEADSKDFSPEFIIAGVKTIAETSEPVKSEPSFQYSKDFFQNNFPEIDPTKPIVQEVVSSPNYKQPSFEIRNGSKKRKKTVTASKMQGFLKEKEGIVSTIANTKTTYKNSVLYLRDKNSPDTKAFVKKLQEINPLMKNIKISKSIKGQKEDVLLVIGDDDLKKTIKH